jgi:hypothetical protein
MSNLQERKDEMRRVKPIRITRRRSKWALVV